QVHLDIHGANLEFQTPEFQEKINKLLDDLGDVVTMHGSYESHEIGRLMEATDWMIIPSVWWENSPIVIQEAFNHGRPIICSDIGGMAEKINDNINGMYFRARNANSLCSSISNAINTDVWHKYTLDITRPISLRNCAAQHLNLITCEISK
ncbi:MAG: glycosyltransferase, partial [Fusobacteriaceae bacterium]